MSNDYKMGRSLNFQSSAFLLFRCFQFRHLGRVSSAPILQRVKLHKQCTGKNIYEIQLTIILCLALSALRQLYIAANC